MFAVLYKFKLKPGHEKDFEKHWCAIATENKELHGSNGSSLHKGHDGFWYAYSRWPSIETWNADREIENKLAHAEMNACIQERYNAIPMDITTDMLSTSNKED